MNLTKKFDDLVTADNPSRLSRELRRASGEHLERRRKAAGWALVAAGSMAAISLYQLGIIPHLPEPPIPGLDADKVDAADQAYEKLSAPDAVLGLHSYTTTLALIAMGGKDRARTSPWIPLALAAKAVVDTVQAGKLTVDQWTKHRAFCSYCLVAAGATFATLPLVLPEAREALRQIRTEA